MNKFFQISLIILLTFGVVITATYIYKLFEWERIDILNVATLSTAIIAIIALSFNARQFFLNKEKVLHERGEFRLNNHYQTKFDRIRDLNITSLVNEKVVDKGRGFQLTANSIHILQHQIIEYLINSYGNDLDINEIYQITNIKRGELQAQFLGVLKKIHDDIKQFSPSIMSYHQNWIDLISNIRKDDRLSTDQKESNISKILQTRLLGYNHLVNEIQTNNFKLVSHFNPEEWSYESIGYLDFIKAFVPTKNTFYKSLGKFKYLMDEQLPKK
ncbi:MAG: hypothetical protein ACFHWX_03175 [Bacteroidota bacterium]